MLILLALRFRLHYIACKTVHFSYFVSMSSTSTASTSTSSSGSLDELLLRKPISEKRWYMTWNQGQLFVWKDGKRLQVQTGSKSFSAGPVLELECIDDRAIQVCIYILRIIHAWHAITLFKTYDRHT